MVKKGRPRKYADNAARQAAYYKRKKDPVKLRLIKRITGLRYVRVSDRAAYLKLTIRELRRLVNRGFSGNHIS